MQKTIVKSICLLLFLTSLPVFAEDAEIKQAPQETNVLQTEEDQSKDENVEQLETSTEEITVQDQGTRQDVFQPEEKNLEINNPQNEKSETEEAVQTGSDVLQSEQEETKNEAEVSEEELSTNKIDMSLIEDEVHFNYRTGLYVFVNDSLYSKDFHCVVMVGSNKVKELNVHNLNGEKSGGKIGIEVGFIEGLKKGDEFSLVFDGGEEKTLIAPNTTLYLITYDPQGGQCVDENGKATECRKEIMSEYDRIVLGYFNVVKEGYKLAGWCREPECINNVFSTTYEDAKNSNFVFYAKWVKQETLEASFKEDGLLLSNLDFNDVKTVKINRKYNKDASDPDDNVTPEDELYGKYADFEIDVFEENSTSLLITKDKLKENMVFNGKYEIHIINQAGFEIDSVTIQNDYDYYVKKELEKEAFEVYYDPEKNQICWDLNEKYTFLSHFLVAESVKMDKLTGWNSYGSYCDGTKWDVWDIIYANYRNWMTRKENPSTVINLSLILLGYEEITYSVDIKEYLKDIYKDKVSIFIDEDYHLHVKFFDEKTFAETYYVSIWDKFVEDNWQAREWSNLHYIKESEKDKDNLTIEVDLRQFEESTLTGNSWNTDIKKALEDGIIEVSLVPFNGRDSEHIVVKMSEKNNVKDEIEKLLEEKKETLSPVLQETVKEGITSATINIEPTTVANSKITVYASKEDVNIKLLDNYNYDITAQINDSIKIDVLPGEIEVTLKVTGDLPKPKDGATIKYYVLRLHEGDEEPTVIDTVYNEKDKTFTFKTDKFSSYSVGYKEIVNNNTNNNDSNNNSNNNNNNNNNNNAGGNSSNNTNVRKPVVNTSVR